MFAPPPGHELRLVFGSHVPASIRCPVPGYSWRTKQSHGNAGDAFLNGNTSSRCTQRRRWRRTVYRLRDLERGILTGSILEVQRDRLTRERKYRIRGSTGPGRPIEQVVKFGPTGKLVVITVYEPEGE